ncbi:phospholipase A1 1-like isoform X2 [Pseudomyrmex gracilis]|uniref:phospholipase A1 1-like isoform X2 n=1 Tax=Pseudomyrmex gracilis TaxID=219809 RepID=UPI0009954288|nr:phospholipase A1 1-like isoform X2 [Pseudomyrmex gracilis]
MALPSFLVPMLCHLYIFRRGDTTLHLTLLPTGNCFYCCPIQLNRDVEFQLYTRRNPTYPTILDPNDVTTLWRSNFNVKHPTVVYIHGYSDSTMGKGPVAIRNAYLRRGHFNVILVDWARLAVLPWYVTAVRNTRLIGPYIARMVSWLDKQKAVPLSKIHVIGFSLGAEAAGFMGKALRPRKGIGSERALYAERNALSDRQNHWIGPGLSLVYEHRRRRSLDMGRRRFCRRHSHRRRPFRLPQPARSRRFLSKWRQETTARLRFEEHRSHGERELQKGRKSTHYLRTQSGLALLRGIGGESLRVSR